MPVRIPVPFKAARAEEAAAATSESFKAITRRRVEVPAFRKAAEQFVQDFATARDSANKARGKRSA